MWLVCDQHLQCESSASEALGDIITLYACVWACLKNEASHDTVQDTLRGVRCLEHHLPCHLWKSMQSNLKIALVSCGPTWCTAILAGHVRL